MVHFFWVSRWLTWLGLGIVSCWLALGLSTLLGGSGLVNPEFLGREAGATAIAASPTPDLAYTWDLPTWAPRPLVPVDNPMTTAKVELGRHLFYEKRLSVNGQQSCATCHVQALAFTDGRPQGVGTTGEIHPRNSMSLANVAYASVLTWANPLMRHLEQQMLVPLFGEAPVELGMAGKEQQILAMLQADPAYLSLFARAFPETAGPDGTAAITLRNLTLAIAAFERTLIALNSPYDRYRYGGDTEAISASAQRGETLFHSERLECFHCHGGLIFSDSVQHERLAFSEIAFHNTGLYNLDGQGAYPAHNTGVYEITHNPQDMGRFKAPTLRNIALTAPYMHDGSVPTLEAAIAHYAAGGRTIPDGPNAGVGHDSPRKSNFIQGFELTDQERQDLLAFLNALTDENFIHNPRFSDPHGTAVIDQSPEPSSARQ